MEFSWKGEAKGRVRILVTGVGGNVGQGILKALAHSRLASWVVGTDANPLSMGLYAVDRGYVVPIASDTEHFVEEFTEIIRKENVQLVFVGPDQEVVNLAYLRERIEAETGAVVLVAAPEIVEQCHDKWLTILLFERLGLDHPATVLCNDKPGLAALVETSGFPLITKPRKGFASKGVRAVSDIKGLSEAARELGADGVAQAYLGSDDEEYTGVILARAPGDVATSFVMRRELLQGTSYRVEPVFNDRLNEVVAEWGRRLNIVGPANFQFRLDNNIPTCFEVNPRFSGTVGMRYLFGYNDVAMAVRYFALGEQIEQPDLRHGTVMRYWNEYFLPDKSWDDIKTHPPRGDA